jgi:hypothetical protein
MCGEMDGDD